MTAEQLLARVKGREREIERLYPGLAGDRLARELYNDLLYGAQARLLARLTQRSYLYEFAYVPDQLRGELFAVPHAVDVPFIFGNKHPNVPMNDVDMRMAARISAYWVRFAKSGDPGWPAHDRATDRWMVFGNDGPVVRTEHRKDRLDFCEQLLGELLR